MHFRKARQAKTLWPLSIALLLLFVPTQGFGRPYYDRWVSAEGAQNFRDIGGYDAGTTAMVALKKVFRSDALNALTTQGVATVRSVGVLTIVDLRTTGEVASYPDVPALNAFARHVYLPIGFSGADWITAYRNLLLQNGWQWSTVMHLLADPANLPLDYHCQAGRDRTGTCTALILATLGVDRRTIIEDYMLSNRPYPAILPEYIATVLDEIELAGGPDLFLESIGVSSEVRQAVRENLLVLRPTAVRVWHLY